MKMATPLTDAIDTLASDVYVNDSSLSAERTLPELEERFAQFLVEQA
jgi:hypothetical protein